MTRPRQNRNGSGNQAGFTLIELMISMVVLLIGLGGLLVLLDGLDEVPTDKLDDTIQGIRKLVDQHPECRYVISCPQVLRDSCTVPRLSRPIP